MLNYSTFFWCRSFGRISGNSKSVCRGKRFVAREDRVVTTPPHLARVHYEKERPLQKDAIERTHELQHPLHRKDAGTYAVPRVRYFRNRGFIYTSERDERSLRVTLRASRHFCETHLPPPPTSLKPAPFLDVIHIHVRLSGDSTLKTRDDRRCWIL